ncbi:DNA-binding protein [Burkholderia sp. WAC0059]|uniref:H-NS histone family protein n=1 Tax=Burkholderia sp. WAC0059 TaxID=2066022 RepID=UPI000C7F1391|nr:H-NS histone family protein [Burkholderia sp. WAC0059]PLY99951.1 DNA-binding protein [Burkholderia sp. WAC0059]
MATKSIADLKAQLEKTQAELDAAIAAESAAVLTEIREKVTLYGFTEKDVFGRKRAGGTRGEVAAKYQNPKTGETWSGRGRAPAWIKDVPNRDKFLIK